MIEVWQGLTLALVQGLTEFLPISSSAHLLLPTLLLGWQDQGLAFDVAVHVGTLGAVLVYFRIELLAYLRVGVGIDRSTQRRREILCLAVATVPAVAVGLLAGDLIEEQLRTVPVIAATTLLFGLLLGWAQGAARRSRETGWARVSLALLVGCAQALALVPGVSRSGVTMTAAVLLGLTLPAAARLSFLMSIPVIAGAGLLKALDLLTQPVPVAWGLLSLAALVAGVTAYLTIALFLRFVARVGLLPFMLYRVVLALLLVALWRGA